MQDGAEDPARLPALHQEVRAAHETKRIEGLQRKLDDGTLQPADLPGGVRRGAGISDKFFGKTIREIEHECRHAQ